MVEDLEMVIQIGREVLRILACQERAPGQHAPGVVIRDDGDLLQFTGTRGRTFIEMPKNGPLATGRP